MNGWGLLNAEGRLLGRYIWANKAPPKPAPDQLDGYATAVFKNREAARVAARDCYAPVRVVKVSVTVSPAEAV